MSLPNAVQDALRPSLLLTWYEEDSTTAVDLTDATLSGFIRYGGYAGTVVPIAGTLTVIDGAAGEFRWDFDADDVANAGKLSVQFVATFSSGTTPAKTFQTEWNVERSLG